jgi:hypothetical protein
MTTQLQEKLQRLNQGETIFLTDEEAAAIGAVHEDALSEQDAADSHQLPADHQPE